MHVEGIVAKHRRSRYEPGRRSPTWLKIKIRPEQELVVGGWTPGEGNAKDLGAVVVGVYEGDELGSPARSARGSTRRTRKDLRQRLEALATDSCPFDPLPGTEGRAPHRPLDPPGARDPRGAGRLDPRGLRPPDLVQGNRRRHGPAGGRPRAPDHAGSRPIVRPRPRSRETKPMTQTRRRRRRSKPCQPSVRRQPEGRRCLEGACAGQTVGGRREEAGRDRRPRLPRLGRQAVDRHRSRARGARGHPEGGRLAGRRPGAQAHEPRQAALPRQGGRRPARDQARARPLLRPDRAGDPAAPRRAAAQPPPLPEWRRRPGLLAEGHPVHGAEVPHDLARDRVPRAGGPRGERPPHRRPGRRPSAGSATRRRSRSTRGPPRSTIRGRRPSPSSTSIPARRRAGRRPSRWRASTGPPSSISACARIPRLTGSARDPGLDPHRPRQVQLRGHQPLGRASVAGDRGHGPGTVSLGVGQGEAARTGAPRLHPERADQDARRPVCRPSGRGCPRLRADPLGGAGRSRPSARIAGRSATSSSGSTEVGDLFAPAQTDHQELPPV